VKYTLKTRLRLSRMCLLVALLLLVGINYFRLDFIEGVKAAKEARINYEFAVKYHNLLPDKVLEKSYDDYDAKAYLFFKFADIISWTSGMIVLICVISLLIQNSKAENNEG
jgi:hypothetical protein